MDSFASVDPKEALVELLKESLAHESDLFDIFCGLTFITGPRLTHFNIWKILWMVKKIHNWNHCRAVKLANLTRMCHSERIYLIHHLDFLGNLGFSNEKSHFVVNTYFFTSHQVCIICRSCFVHFPFQMRDNFLRMHNFSYLDIIFEISFLLAGLDLKLDWG